MKIKLPKKTSIYCFPMDIDINIYIYNICLYTKLILYINKSSRLNEKFFEKKRRR